MDQDQAYVEAKWPRENLSLSCYAHQIMNYRYHWHPTEYELNILLQGNQEFCLGTDTQFLETDDVMLVSPGIGHASFAPAAKTYALVLHFSMSVFRPFLKKGFAYSFPTCHSNAANRYNSGYNRLRFYAGQIFSALSSDGLYAKLTAKASMELLAATLCTMFAPQTVSTLKDEEIQYQETVRFLIQYIEQHYREKISLEDLAQISQYNRTYISTLFKDIVGVNFHEYLMRVRFQKALMEIARTSNNLTRIAIDNGFSDLKSFTARFRETLHRTPAEYRAQLSSEQISDGFGRNYISRDDLLLQKKLSEYLRLSDASE